MKLPISVHRYLAIIGVVALSLLLLRPACDVLALQLDASPPSSMAVVHHDSGAGPEHGHTVQLGSHGASLAAVASAAKSLPLPAVPVSAALAVPALVFSSRITAPGAGSAPPLSYYARSARILR